MKSRVVVSVALVLGMAACRKSHHDDASTPVAAPAASKLSADRLLPGELAEGRERAMGLALPRDMRVVRAFGDTIYARGHVGAESLSEYVSHRIDATAAEVRVDRTLFPRAHVKGTPEGKLLRIEVVRDEGATELVVNDISPKPMTPGLSEDERWKQAGVVKGGRASDPSAF